MDLARWLRKSFKAVLDGVVSLVRFSSGTADDQPALIEAVHNACTVRDIVVGSRQQSEAMNRAIDANDIHPIIDKKCFQFEEAVDAYQYQWEQKNYGKVVITV